MVEGNASAAPPTPRRRWARRLLKVAGLLVLFLLLLVLLLPTIITSRLVLGPALDFAGGMTKSQITLKSLRFGWITPFELRGLKMTGLSNEPFLDLEHLSFERSMIGVITEEDRLGTVTVRGLTVEVERYPGGAFNFTPFIPPADPSAPPPPPAEPFELVLSKLIPTLPLPTAAIDVRLSNLDVRFADRSTTAPMTAGFGIKNATLVYTGANAPLELKANGNLRFNALSVPWKSDASLTQWTDGTTIRIAGSQSSGTIDLADRRLMEWQTSIDADRLTAEASLLLAASGALKSGTLPIPEMDGTVRLATALDTSSNPARIGFGVEFQDLSASDGTAWQLRPMAITLETTTTLDRATFALGRADALLKSSWLNGTAEVRAESADRYQFALRGEFEASPLLDQLDGDLLSPVPPVDAGFTVSTTGVASTNSEVAAALDFGVPLRSVDLSTIAFPPAFRARNQVLDLTDLSMEAHVEVTRSAAGAIELLIDGRNAWGDLRVVGNHQPDSSEGSVELSASLTRVGGWIDRNFEFAPAVRLGGELNVRHEVGLRDGLLAQAGSLDVQDLLVASAPIPNGEYRDQITARWDAETALAEPTFRSRLGAALTSNYADFDTSATGSIAGLAALAVNTTLRLEPLVKDFATPFLPAEPALNIRGTLAAGLTLEAASEAAWNIATTARSGEDFRVELPDFHLAIDRWDGRFSTQFRSESEKFILDRIAFGAGLQDVVRLAGTGRVATDTVRHDVSLETSTTVDWGILAATVENYLANRQNVLLAVEGATTIGVSAETDVSTSPTLVFHSPARMNISTATLVPSLTVMAAGQEVALADLRDERQMRIELPSSDPLQAEMDLRGLSSVAEIVWGGGVTASALQLADNTQWRPSSGLQLRVNEAAVGGIVSTAGGFQVSVPSIRNRLEVDLSPTFDAARTKWSGALGDFGSGELAVDWQRTVNEEKERDVVAVAASAGMGLGGLVALESGPFVEQFLTELTGQMDTSLKVKVIRAGNPGDWSLATIQSYDGEWRGTLSDLRMASPYAQLESGSASISVYTFDQQWFLDTEVKPGLVRAMTVPLPYLQTMSALAQVRLSEYRHLSIDNAILSIPDGGTNVEFRGEVRELDRLQGSELAPLDLVTSIPSQLFLTFSQDFSKLGVYGEGLGGEGSIGLVGRMEVLPNQQVALDASLEVKQASLLYTDMASLSKLDGNVPYTKRLFFDPAGRDRRRPLNGEVDLAESRFSYAPYTLTVRDTSVAGRLANTSFVMQGRSSDFFGGTFDSQFILRRDEGDPSLEAVFSITGFDGASIFPSLKRVRLEKRGFDGFGFARVRLRDGGTVDGLLDDMVLRVDLTSFGREFLREGLRTVDPQGANPGIQSLNAMLAASSPVRGFVDLRGALLTCEVTMSTPTGSTVNVPIFDRTSVANLLEPYFDPSFNQLLALGRDGLALLLAENMDELRANLPQGTTP